MNQWKQQRGRWIDLAGLLVVSAAALGVFLVAVRRADSEPVFWIAWYAPAFVAIGVLCLIWPTSINARRPAVWLGMAAAVAGVALGWLPPSAPLAERPVIGPFLAGVLPPAMCLIGVLLGWGAARVLPQRSRDAARC